MGVWCVMLALVASNSVAAGKPMKPPLHVNGDEKLLYVHAQGIPVGELLARMGAASSWSVRVLGPEAAIPVWVYADGEEPRLLIQRVANAAGLVVVEKGLKDHTLWVTGLPPSSDGPRPRLRSPQPTTVYPSGAPEELALLLRTHVLSPLGSAVPVPARGAIIVEDDAEGSLAARRLVGLLTPNANLGPLVVEPLPRLETRGAAAPCPALELKPWKALDLQAGVANGEPIGQVLVTLASLQNRTVVVGCGGHAPAFASVRKDTPLEELATEHGLRAAETTPSNGAQKGAGVVFVEENRAPLLTTPSTVAGQSRRALLLFPVRKPEQYTPALTQWLKLKVTALPALGWIAVEHETDGPRGQPDAVALQVDRTLRDLMPKPAQPLPALRVVALDQDAAATAVP